MEKKNDGKWSIRTVTSSGEAAEECFDYVVMATGLYSEPKYIPDVPGKEAFNGNTRVITPPSSPNHLCKWGRIGVLPEEYPVQKSSGRVSQGGAPGVDTK